MWNKPLQESSPIPLWFQIADRLRSAIADGTFEAGNALPSESQLNATFGISRATSKAALDSLKQEGLIIRKSGKGSIVQAARVEQPAVEMYSFSDDMLRRGLRPSYSTVYAGRVRATDEVGNALDIQPKSVVYHSRRILKADDKPIGLALSWIPLNVFGDAVPPTEEDLNRSSLYRWLNERCNVTVASAHETIEAALAVSELAAELDIVAGAAILIIRRRSVSLDGSPAEYAVLHFRADRYRLHLETGSLVKR